MATNNAINQIGKLPSFMAVNNADQGWVTGDGTDYVCQFVNEIYDVTNSFDGTSTFTALLTGKYSFSFGFYLNGVAAAMTKTGIWLETTSATYRLLQANLVPIAVGGDIFLSYSLECPMTVGDTAKIHLQISNGLKQASIIGATNAGWRTPYFSGYMISGV
jgi:hypothetical protein